MARRGAAGGAVTSRHIMTEADQDTYHHVYGPCATPVLSAAPGAINTVEMDDAFKGKISSESGSLSVILNPFMGAAASVMRARRRPVVGRSEQDAPLFADTSHYDG